MEHTSSHQVLKRTQNLKTLKLLSIPERRVFLRVNTYLLFKRILNSSKQSVRGVTLEIQLMSRL